MRQFHHQIKLLLQKIGIYDQQIFGVECGLSSTRMSLSIVFNIFAIAIKDHTYFPALNISPLKIYIYNMIAKIPTYSVTLRSVLALQISFKATKLHYLKYHISPFLS